jgi:ASC-1-like (ASCH) protein
MNIHHLRLHKIPFEKILAGEKKVEVRLNDEKRQHIEVGDNIIFSLREDDNEKISKHVSELQYFDNFEELYLVYPEEKTYNAAQYYSAGDIQRFGLLVLALK